VVEATDALSGLAGPPSLLLSNGSTVLSLSTTDTTSPFHYGWTVDSSTAPGRWDILVLAQDQLGNASSLTGHYLWVAQPTLTLSVAPVPLYVRPGQVAQISLAVSNLPVEVIGCQAFLGYDSTFFHDPTGGAVQPGDSPWEEVIWDSWRDAQGVPGQIDTAVGVLLIGGGGTQADGVIARINLVAKAHDGLTTVVFRPDLDPDPYLTGSTFLVDVYGQPVWPQKVNSQTIVVDGTGPALNLLSATQAGTNVLDGAAPVLEGEVELVVEATDALSGLAGPPSLLLSNGSTVLSLSTTDTTSPFHYTWTVDSSTANGIWNILLSVADLPGNVTTNIEHYLRVNKNQIIGQVELEGFVGTGTQPPHSRAVTFVASGGVSSRTWTLLLSNTAGAIFDFVLTDVPDGTTALSAKTAWNLRRKLPVTLNAYGRAMVNFVSEHKLRGGDLNNDNQVQTLDYALLRSRWYTSDPVADINGDGFVGTVDYSLLRLNWLQAGEPP